ncbi:MAG: hypothetical protein ACYC6P_15090 [Ignavibacteriaceae bacterium]
MFLEQEKITLDLWALLKTIFYKNLPQRTQRIRNVRREPTGRAGIEVFRSALILPFNDWR